MAITAQEVNKLRQMTGAGMMDCKKALNESNGDFEVAIDMLRKTGQKISASRADRQTLEGSVFVKINETQDHAFLVALGCETDFVAKNEEFQNLGRLILDQAVRSQPASLAELAGLSIENRPICEHLIDLIGKIGEKIEIVDYQQVSGERVVSYIHSNGKLGVLVALTGIGSADTTEVGKDVAMQIAAMKPVALDKGDVDATIIERELEVGKELARNEGKAEDMLEKIALGRLNKFYKENTLLNQEFVKDPSKTIAQLLAGVNKGLTVKEFKRVVLGA